MTFSIFRRAVVAATFVLVGSQASAQTAIPTSTSTADGGSSSVTVTGLPTNATGDASLVLNFIGDLGVTNEFVTVTIDGTNVGTFRTTGNGHGGDCIAATQTISIPVATLAPLVSDGQINVGYQATPTVNNFCSATGGTGGNISYQVSGTITYAATTTVAAAATPASAMTERFLANRARSLVQNQPDIVRFVDGRTFGSLNADVSQGNGTFDLQGLVAGPLWGAVRGSFTDSDAGDQTYVLGAIGGHTRIGENAVVGAMLQFDFSDESLNDGSEIDGTGWLVGPYFAAQLGTHQLFADGRLLFGQTDNTITPAGVASSDFDGERILATLALEGRIQRGDLALFPGIDLSYVRDEQDEYIDASSTTVAAQTIEQTEAALGMDFESPLAGTNHMLTGGAAAIYSDTDNDGASVLGFDDEWRGRIDLGYRFDYNERLTAHAETFIDGIGSDTDTYGLALRVDVSF